MLRPWLLAKANGFILVWRSLAGITSVPLPRFLFPWVVRAKAVLAFLYHGAVILIEGGLGK
jgi:hypothetical protein